MEADGLDLASFLTDGPVPEMPDDLDELFTEELMQFLNAAETGQPACQQHQPLCHQQLTPVPLAVDAVAPTNIAPSPSSSCSQSKGTSSPSPVPGPAMPATASNAAAVQVQPAVAACSVVPRLVTTTAAQQMWTAMLQAALAPPAAPCVDEAKARTMQPVGTSRQGSRNCSADSSDTDQTDHEMGDSKSRAAGNKRKAPEVDWRQIEDPAERRRQRRLAKNRVTAARSRERKKAMWSELEEKLKSMEGENMQLRAMLEQFARENASLKSQLLNITRAGFGPNGVAGLSQARAGKTMDPATILPVFIVTLLVVCSLLPGDKACALLGSVLPLALVASLMLGANTTSGKSSARSLAGVDCLFRLLHMLGTMLSGSGSRTLHRSFKRLLFERHRYLGRSEMRKLAACAEQQLLVPQEEQEQGIEPCSGNDDVRGMVDEVPESAAKPGGLLASAASLLPALVKMESVCG